MNPMVGPAYSELLYLQAGRLNPGVVKALIPFLPFVKAFPPQFCLSES